MRNPVLPALLFILFTFPAFTQSVVPDPGRKDFAGNLGFLSSDWMEGREAGSKGSFIAADFILSQMMQTGLEPGPGTRRNRQFFQNFSIVRYKPVNTGFSLVENSGKSYSRRDLIPEQDFIIETGPSGFQIEAPLVFAGFGISAPKAGYNDLSGISVRGCIVVVMDGYPGENDTLSPGWKLFGNDSMNEFYRLETKQRNAMENGALALIVVSGSGSLSGFEGKQVNKSMAQSAFSKIKEEAGYEDFNYALPDDQQLIPVCWLGKDASAELLKESGIDLKVTEERIADRLIPESVTLKGKNVVLSAGIKAETMLVRNVIGHIRGVDTTRSIVIGAHYDHLGLRDQLIYNGSDDNASGVAGMLALAGVWQRSGKKPPCNLIFAAWTAEEKGLLGSTFFVRNFSFDNHRILLNMNFDMISRSAPSDVDSKVISIGFLKGTSDLKRMAEKCNGELIRPFTLDLWETAGHGGSDYVPFALRKIPVMSFFSGFHDDYHSPRDVYAKSDLMKMESILILANKIITVFLSSY
ncbi:MAG: M20/M25/M40 family metallo-hydrolase [Bacteroidales bacterium]|nr:M20/M25/M40 family metallo-hydrolase [Bacteroidales bacterium]